MRLAAAKFPSHLAELLREAGFELTMNPPEQI
jgi:hypothetical protein